MISSAIAVVRHYSNVLMLHRRQTDRTYAGWCFPGGKCEPGESPEMTSIRELKEETGLDLIPQEQFGSRVFLSNKDYSISVYGYEVQTGNSGTLPKVTLSDEHIEYRWVNPAFVPADMNIGPATRSVLAELNFPRSVLYWPLYAPDYHPTLPDDPGRFAASRKHDYHTGVDLYCDIGTMVIAMTTGRVVAIEDFTGPEAIPPSPWWNPTKAVFIESAHKVLGYCEITPTVQVGDIVCGGEMIGVVDKPVLKKNKGRPTVMLHLEELLPGSREGAIWTEFKNRPSNLLDPTPTLRLAGVNPRQFELSDYDGIKFNDPSLPIEDSPWWNLTKRKEK